MENIHFLDATAGAAEGGMRMSDYAVSKLITAMGMFIHDLWAMRGDREGVYDETAYYDLAADIQRGCDLMEE